MGVYPVGFISIHFLFLLRFHVISHVQFFILFTCGRVSILSPGFVFHHVHLSVLKCLLVCLAFLIHRTCNLSLFSFPSFPCVGVVRFLAGQVGPTGSVVNDS